jgi:hypothetical protein
MNVLGLTGRGPWHPVATNRLPADEFDTRAVHPDQHDVDLGHDLKQISEPPRLAQDMVHHHVVARHGHPGHGTVKSGASLMQHIS